MTFDDKIKCWNYGHYSSNNYGSCRGVVIGKLDLYFSYNTIVAFRDERGLVIHENDWGTTTGKHLNWINKDKSIRVDSRIFNSKLAECLKRHKL